MATPPKKPSRKKNPVAKVLAQGQFKARVVADKKKNPPKVQPKWRQGEND